MLPCGRRIVALRLQHTVGPRTSSFFHVPNTHVLSTSGWFCLKAFKLPISSALKVPSSDFTWLPLPHHSGRGQITSFQQGLGRHPKECRMLFLHASLYNIPTLSSPWHLSILKLSCLLFPFSSLSIQLFMSRTSVLFTAVSSMRGFPGTR